VRGSAAFRLSPTPGGVLAPPVRDPDARDYIRRVQAADGQRLEPLVQRAIDAFVRGCKADGIWNAIKASCILAGARTLSGALVPLVGTAPTNNNFVSGDYDRETGLVGDGSTKYLNSNAPSDTATPRDDAHLGIYMSEKGGNSKVHIGSLTSLSPLIVSSLQTNSSAAATAFINSAASSSVEPSYSAPTFFGVTRSNNSSFSDRVNGITRTTSASSASPGSLNHFVFARNTTGSATNFTDARIAFYSIGESLDLALLDARVTTLINAIGAAL
jgi:hypothetical protein